MAQPLVKLSVRRSTWRIANRDLHSPRLPLGLFINGWVSERFGYRRTVIAALLSLTGLIALFFCADKTSNPLVTLQVAEILAGIPWGIFQTLTISYAAEVVPVALRGYLTT
jgi:SP family general alpha glucoside:H+ symporter-like MFS transporter